MFNTSPVLRAGDGAAPVEIVVCIPTFRRPELLRQTLHSLAAQLTARIFAVVVAENDAAGGKACRSPRVPEDGRAARRVRDRTRRGKLQRHQRRLRHRAREISAREIFPDDRRRRSWRRRTGSSACRGADTRAPTSSADRDAEFPAGTPRRSRGIRRSSRPTPRAAPYL